MSDEKTALDRAERVLREVLAEQADTVAPPADLTERARRRHRTRVRLLTAAAAAAAVLVGVGIPTGLTLVRADAPPARPAPSPSPPARCEPPSDPVPDTRPTAAPVPADQLPRQTGVRGSLAGDRALVDAVLVAGWQGLGPTGPS